jgi:hypothetical protein
LKAGNSIANSATPTTCADALYTQALGFFNALRAPAIFTPGDNDWTDCDRPSNGAFSSLERLDHERRRDLDHPARGAIFLREQKRPGERVPGRAVDAVQARLAVGAQQSKQGDAVGGVDDIEIDARDVRPVASVLMALVEEVAPILVARRRSPGVVVRLLRPSSGDETRAAPEARGSASTDALRRRFVWCR